MVHQLVTRQMVPADLDTVWRFFSQPANLNRLTPPDLQFQILAGAEQPMHSGQIIRYRIRLLPLVAVQWVTEIKDVTPLQSFVDEQRLGPYRFWHHRHDFVPHAEGIEIIDTVHYSVGYSLLGELLHGLWIRGRLQHIFKYRRSVITELFTGSGAQTDE